MKEWLLTGELKSVQHQEFIYTYYWLVAYLWRYALYAQQKIGQPDIKKILKYNPNEKRINYVIKKGGLLDMKEYTLPTSNYPVSWSMKKGEDVRFDMLHDFDEEDRKLLASNQSHSYFVKSPVKHMGDPENEGIFWNASNTHLMNGEVLTECMKNNKLGCAGFYLYGLLVFIRDKSNSDTFLCANKTLMEYTGWSKNKIYEVSSELVECGLINKTQKAKRKGSVNEYVVS